MERIAIKDRTLGEYLSPEETQVTAEYGIKKFKKGGGTDFEIKDMKTVVDISNATVLDIIKDLKKPSLSVRIQNFTRPKGEEYCQAFKSMYGKGQTLKLREIGQEPDIDPEDTTESIQAKIERLTTQLESMKAA